MEKKLTYRDAGVDIDAGNYSVKLIKDSVKATYRPEVLGDLGGFGGLFALNSGKYKEPVLVSGTDGVGTKLRLAFMLDKHGVKISAHISGDLLHLQFMFVMAILALDFILMIVVLWAYKYLMYKEYLGSLDSLTGVMGRKMFLNKCVY